jgi:hypothetical protein
VENNVKVVDAATATATATAAATAVKRQLISTRDIINFQLKVDVPPSVEAALNTVVFAWNQFKPRKSKVKMAL